MRPPEEQPSAWETAIITLNKDRKQTNMDTRGGNTWHTGQEDWQYYYENLVNYYSHYYTYFSNLGSLEIRASTYILQNWKNLPIFTIPLQFPVEMNTRGSKTLFPFHTKCDLQEQFWLFSHSYLQNGMLWLQNNFNILDDLKTDTFERCRHIYSFICMSLLTQ